MAKQKRSSVHTRALTDEQIKSRTEHILRQSRERRIAAARAAEATSGECGGECSGRGYGFDYTEGPCPDGCKGHTFSDKAIEEAKSSARRDANDNCQKSGGPDCLCTGGGYREGTLHISSCTTVDTPDGKGGKKKQCEWMICYEYVSGVCAPVA